MTNISPNILALHQRAIVCDAHCDTILDLDRQGRTLGQRSSQGHIDLPRLFEGGITAQIFALFVENKYLPNEARRRTRNLLDRFNRELADNQEHIFLATRAADIRRAKAEGRIAAILAIEGGVALEGKMEALYAFYQAGVRLLTLTWSRRNALGDGTGVVDAGGLTDFGLAVVQEMNHLGMLVDVAHLAGPGVIDVLRVSQSPVIASHANARALCDHVRNLSDEQARAIAGSGGLICVTFVPVFVDAHHATLERLVDHIVHLLQVAGEDHVGVGSDYDGFGFGNPEFQFHDLPDVSYLPRLTEAMLRRGLSERVVEKVLGLNFLRVFGQVAGA